MSAIYYFILPTKGAAKEPANWLAWPVSMIPVALVGLLLASRIWNATPQKSAAAGH